MEAVKDGNFIFFPQLVFLWIHHACPPCPVFKFEWMNIYNYTPPQAPGKHFHRTSSTCNYESIRFQIVLIFGFRPFRRFWAWSCGCTGPASRISANFCYPYCSSNNNPGRRLTKIKGATQICQSLVQQALTGFLTNKQTCTNVIIWLS